MRNNDWDVEKANDDPSLVYESDHDDEDFVLEERTSARKSASRNRSIVLHAPEPDDLPSRPPLERYPPIWAEVCCHLLVMAEINIFVCSLVKRSVSRSIGSAAIKVECTSLRDMSRDIFSAVSLPGSRSTLSEQHLYIHGHMFQSRRIPQQRQAHHLTWVSPIFSVCQ